MNTVDKNDRDLLVEISVMYYLENRTQAEIAQALFISRPKVSRLLKRARELNVVDIQINYDSDEINRISKAIQRRYGLESVVVIKSLSAEAETLKEIGRAAAKELSYLLVDGIKIGMSWGRSVRAMVDAVKEQKLNNVKIVEVFGMVEFDEESSELLSIGFDLSKKLNGTFYSLPSPLYISDQKTRDILLSNPVIVNTLKMINECDFILTGLGVADEGVSQRIWEAHIDSQTRKELLNLNAQGYLCAHFFDANGQFINHPINENIIGIKTETIRDKKIILLAGGIEKANSLRAILNSGYINNLISDDKTLKEIIRMDKASTDS